MQATHSRADAAGRAARWAGAGGAGWAERLIGPSALGRAGVTGWAAGKKEPLGFAGGSKLGRGEREKRAGPGWASGMGFGLGFPMGWVVLVGWVLGFCLSFSISKLCYF